MSTQDEFLAAQSELVKKLDRQVMLQGWALIFCVVIIVGFLVHELNLAALCR